MHSDVLTQAQLELLGELGPFADEQHFYLGGGTAVALQVGHRRSDDLDWFRPAPLADPLLLAEALRGRVRATVVQATAPGTLHCQVAGVRVSFMEYRYALLEPVRSWPDYGCSLASLADLACMKLAAVAQRGARRDFLDVWAMTRAYAPLDTMLDDYRRRYSVRDVGHLLYALSYFDDADAEPTPLLLWPIGWDAVKSDFRRWVRALA